MILELWLIDYITRSTTETVLINQLIRLFSRWVSDFDTDRKHQVRLLAYAEWVELQSRFDERKCVKVNQGRLQLSVSSQAEQKNGFFAHLTKNVY